MAVAPTGTVTFLFTDIEGSTELLRRLREEYGSAVSLHRKLLRGAVEPYGGFEVDTQGDSFFFTFQRASDAVQAAIDGQRALAEHAWPDSANLRVRMGLHTGEALLEDGRYHGLSVHRGARIAGVAHGGQVLLSESTRSLLADEEKLSAVGFRDLGPLALKDFDRPIRVYRLVAPGLEDVDRKPGARPKSRRRWVSAAAGVTALAALLTVVLVTQLGSGDAAVKVPADNVAVVDSATGKARHAVAVGRAPNSIVFGSGAAWIASSGSGTVTRVDATTHAASSPIGGFQSAPYQLVAGAGQVWATEQTAGFATIDVATQTVSAPIPLQAPSGLHYSAQAIAYGDNALWIGGGLPPPSGLVLLKVDPASAQIVKSVPVGSDTQGAITVGAGGVWVTEQLSNTVIEFDPTTLHVLRRIGIGGPTAIAVGAGSLWVCGADDKAVWRLTLVGGRVSRTEIAMGAEPVAVAVGHGAVWAALADGALARIDTATNVPHSTEIAPTLNGLAVGGGAVWALAGPVSFL
jgi:class 3 adenylate cyclase/streptogramin lyase